MNLLLLELIARYIYDRETWFSFDSSGPIFNKVCNKLTYNYEKEFTSIKVRRYWKDGIWVHEETSYYKDLKHGIEQYDRVKTSNYIDISERPIYSCRWRMGKKHGQEIHRKWGKYSYYCEWKNGLKHGTEIYYFPLEKDDLVSYEKEVITWKNGRKTFSVCFNEEYNINKEIIYDNGKELQIYEH